MQEALASDNFNDALKEHKIICEKELKHYKDSYKDCSVKFKNIDQMRESFKKLSSLYLVNGNKKQIKDLITAECPMAKAKWLQTKGSIRNPYYGKSMLECGQKI